MSMINLGRRSFFGAMLAAALPRRFRGAKPVAGMEYVAAFSGSLRPGAVLEPEDQAALTTVVDPCRVHRRDDGGFFLFPQMVIGSDPEAIAEAMKQSVLAGLRRLPEFGS